jgi:hypothetical protein
MPTSVMHFKQTGEHSFEVLLRVVKPCGNFNLVPAEFDINYAGILTQVFRVDNGFPVDSITQGIVEEAFKLWQTKTT